MLAFVAVVVGAGLLVGEASTFADQSDGPVPISGGIEAETCQWPTAVNFKTSARKCSGVLVHPELVVTAAHCVAEHAPISIRFGEAYTLAEIKADVDFCEGFPGFDADSVGPDDIGFCKLAEPVLALPPTPVTVGCAAERIRPGVDVAIVGYGVSELDENFGRKRFAFTDIEDVSEASGAIWIGAEPISGCLGDSGGPAYIQYPDRSWHAVGVLSGGPACGEGASVYAPIHPFVDWIEDASGVDITPCHDDDGAWAPGRACQGFAMDPLYKFTSWATRCDSELTGEGVEACPPPDWNEDDVADGPDEVRDALDESWLPPAPATGCRTGGTVPAHGVALLGLVLAAIGRPCRRRRRRRPRHTGSRARTK